MELSFQTSQLSYLNCILQTTLTQEETGELVVPDSLPDILKIVDSYADPMLRGKECRSGSIILSGGIKGGILYQPEDQSAARSLDFYLPFTIKYDSSSLAEHSQILCDLKVRSVDGYAINSRKAMLRVNLDCMLSAYDATEETLYSVVNPPECLETKCSFYKLNLPLEYAEKSFTINDLLEPPLGHPPIAQICKVHSDITLQDQKLVGDKAIFKGFISCKMLYIGEDSHYYSCRKSITFSQYCELQQEYDREDIAFFPIISACDWELQNAKEGSAAAVSIQILAQVLISGTKELSVTEDAFCLKGQLLPQWTPYTFQACLDQQCFRQAFNRTIAEPYETILDAEVYTGFPSFECNHDVARILVPMQVHLLGCTSDHVLANASEKIEWEKDLPISRNCSLLSNVSITDPIDCQSTADGYMISFDLTVSSLFFASQTVTSLTGGAIEQSNENMTDTPSIILRKFEPNTTLWQIAKQYRAKPGTIQTVNHLDSESLSNSQIILIPIS